MLLLLFIFPYIIILFSSYKYSDFYIQLIKKKQTSYNVKMKYSETTYSII
uniref:Uncharacterized protein n=1 Tax=Strongyloides stercoralis TaxID=6248 RepID=A0A0K0DZE4_STRER